MWIDSRHTQDNTTAVYDCWRTFKSLGPDMDGIVCLHKATGSPATNGQASNSSSAAARC